MARNNKKLIIKKKIELSNNKEKLIKEKPNQLPPKKKVLNNVIKNIGKEKRIELTKKSNLNGIKTTPQPIKKFDNKNLERLQRKTGIILNKTETFNKKSFFSEKFIKKELDYDMIICISSYNRYEKVLKLINDLNNQISTTQYKVKIILMNDGSTDDRYDSIQTDFSDIDFLKNKENGGKILYWNTITKLWSQVKKYNTHTLCQIDDDFIISRNFINNLLDKYFEMKNISNKFIAFHYHTYFFSLKNVYDEKYWFDIKNNKVDGGVLYDIEFIKLLNFSIEKQVLNSKFDSSKVWVYISNMIEKYCGSVYRFRKSLVKHDGNDDSKLNPLVRNINKMITKNFIDE